MTTRPNNPELLERGTQRNNQRQIVRLHSQGELDVGSGSRVQPSDDRGGNCRFENPKLHNRRAL
jgi:hypothetical protein